MYVDADGNFGKVETEIIKFQKKQKEEWIRGGWHTTVSLTQKGWTESLDRIYTLPCRQHGKPL